MAVSSKIFSHDIGSLILVSSNQISYIVALIECTGSLVNRNSVDVCLTAKEATKKKIERVIRREFSIEIRKKEEEIELINQVF